MRPIRETGSFGAIRDFGRPNYKNCGGGPVGKGEWERVSSNGESFKAKFGVDFKGVIGIDLSTEKNYGRDRKVIYDIKGTARKQMCGSNSDPSVARRVMEKFY